MVIGLPLVLGLSSLFYLFPFNPSKMRRASDLRLPTNRIKTIMKSSPNVESIKQESLFVMTRAAEMFVRHLTLESYRESKSRKTFDYDAVASYVQSQQYLNFVAEILPHRMTKLECLRWIEEQNTQKIEEEAAASGSS